MGGKYNIVEPLYNELVGISVIVHNMEVFLL